MKTTATGTGQHSTVAPSRGSTISKMTIGATSTRSIKAPMSPNQSQKTTTAPSVKMPPVTLVRDTKTKTKREIAVAHYNASNPAHPGGREQRTQLEREWAQVAGGKNPGTSATMPGRPKQAQ